jgi:hypothetical protein
VKRAGLALAAALAALAALTAFALEAGDVAVVTTTAPDGAARRTPVWFARLDGALWLEAGARENPWFVDELARPRLALALPGEPPRAFIATPLRDAASQRRVRAALRAKYGWRDAWVGALVDASRSVAVRLTPAARSRDARPRSEP